MSETKRNNPRLNQHPPNEDGANAVVAPKEDGANSEAPSKDLPAKEPTPQNEDGTNAVVAPKEDGANAVVAAQGDGANAAVAPNEDGAITEAPSKDLPAKEPTSTNEDGANAVVAAQEDGANAVVAPKEDTAISADSSKEEKTTSEKRRDKQRRKKIFRIIRRILFALFVLAMLAAFIGFIYFRWMMHDDATDIEGKWRLAGSETPVVIEKGRFVLTDEIVYDYTIDPDAKTIAFEFGALNGKARYRFSVDRNMLAIQDGEFDWGGNLSNDIGWTIDALLNELQGNPTKSPELAEGGMVLERIQ